MNILIRSLFRILHAPTAAFSDLHFKKANVSSLLFGVVVSMWMFPAIADGLPKAEEGWACYCARERVNSYYKSPNSIITLKLQV